MWTHLIALIVGFAAGCKFKDLFCISENSRSSQTIKSQCDISENTVKSSSSNAKVSENNSRESFSLASIKYLFDDYGVKLINAGSFNVLLREIRNKCYNDIMKKIVTTATSPQLLVDLLKTETVPSFSVDIIPSNKAPFIDVSKLDELIKRENVNPNEVQGVDEKVSFLLALSHTRGIADFKNTLSFYFSDIIKSAEANEDIAEKYEQVMKILKTRYEFIK